MVVELRYFRFDPITVNGVTDESLLLTKGSVEKKKEGATADTTSICYFGIRIWKRSELGVETEITAGVPVAVVSKGPPDEGLSLQIGNYTPAETVLISTDCLCVRLYGKFETGRYRGLWTVLGNFYSPQLNATKLEAVEWEVRYWTHRVVLGWPPSLFWRFYYNAVVMRDSSVEYSITLAPPAEKMGYSDGFVTVSVG